MTKVDLSDVCFLVHVRIDTVARQQNLEIIQEFYRKYADNTQFIFIEDDAEQKITESVTLTENDKYIFHENPGIYLRPKCYNIGAEHYKKKHGHYPTGAPQVDIDIVVRTLKKIKKEYAK